MPSYLTRSAAAVSASWSAALWSASAVEPVMSSRSVTVIAAARVRAALSRTPAAIASRVAFCIRSSASRARSCSRLTRSMPSSSRWANRVSTPAACIAAVSALRLASS